MPAILLLSAACPFAPTVAAGGETTASETSSGQGSGSVTDASASEDTGEADATTDGESGETGECSQSLWDRALWNESCWQ